MRISVIILLFVKRNVFNDLENCKKGNKLGALRNYEHQVEILILYTVSIEILNERLISTKVYYFETCFLGF